MSILTDPKRRRLKLRKLAMKIAAAAREPEDKQDYSCPLCDYHGAFKPRFGSSEIRLDGYCPQCGSLERQRHIALWLKSGSVEGFGRTLHFAPEKRLFEIFSARSDSITGADITEGRADIVLNIEAMNLADGAFDTMVCNHVLEHVDDRKALSEMFRVLAPGGLAVITVPIVATWDTSYEVAGITTERDRHRHFGQRDHVRYFGWDLPERIRSAGFELSLICVTGDEAARYSINRDHVIFLARKPVDG